MRNLPKIYLVDTGLSRKVKTSDYGRLLENAVFLELKRKAYEIFYSSQNGECDFIIKKEGDNLQAIQVTWELGENNKEREMQGLVQSCKSFNIKEGKIITYGQEETLNKDNIKIDVIPYWKWILKRD